jgi:hypothetical protein
VANLTPHEFETLLTRLDPDRDRAAQGYELLRRKLVKFFERNKCAGTEALADETIDRAATPWSSHFLSERADVQSKIAAVIALDDLGSRLKPYHHVATMYFW